MDLASPAPSLADRVLAFARSLVTPSWPMLLTAAGIFAAFVALFLSLTEPRLYALINIYPGFNRLTDNYYLFYRVTRYLAPAEKPRAVRIAVVGGSTTRDAFLSEDFLASETARLSGAKIEAIDLTSSGQDLGASWALAEQALCNGVDIVVFAVNMRQMRRGPGKEPLIVYGYDSPAWREASRGAIGAAETSEALTSLDRRKFYAASLQIVGYFALYDVLRIRHPSLPNRGAQWRRHRNVDRKMPDVNRARLHFDTVEKIVIEAREKFYVSSIALVEKLAESARRCGGQLVLFEPPLNPVLRDPAQRPAYARAHTEHGRSMRQLADRLGLRLIMPNDHVDFQPDDFVDFGHLRTARAMRAVTAYVAENVAPMVKPK